MSGKIDTAKGRIEEAAGALAGNDKLRKKGKKDQAGGKVRKDAAKAIDKTVKRMKK